MMEEITEDVTPKEWKQVERKIKDELDKRSSDSFRKEHEMIWKEVDRQIRMQAPKIRRHTEENNDWHSAIELGELAKASEILTDDVMRLAFPNTRAWFEAHIELQPKLDPETGENIAPSQEDQFQFDGMLRALMAQQHQDFGFKARFNLSVKEALHHGSFVAEVRGEDQVMFTDQGGMASLHAPVWVPHSMWNCYPDPSPSVVGTNLFYSGGMIVKEYMPLWKLKQVAQEGLQDGWMPSQLSKIKKRSNKVKDAETEDVELVKFYGDCVIDRSSGNVFLPNSKVILANDTIVFYAANKLPFANIIFNGYERIDVRDPYYTSPLIKLAPIHKAASQTANKYLDAVALFTEPPGVYDSNDPQFVKDGGPRIAPSAMTGTKYFGKGVQFLQTGDPNAALQGLQLFMEQLRSGTSVDSIRSGSAGSERQTATEVRAQAARGEVRVVDFVDKLEFSLKTYLYMQHELNKMELQNYPFYNPEMDAPDFMRLSAQEIPETVHFDVVGARGILGEEERNQKMTAVTAFASSNPLFANLLKPADILKEMYQDAGVKNPERFLNIPTNEMASMEERIRAEYEGGINEMEIEMKELREKLEIAKVGSEARILEAQLKSEAKIGEAAATAQIMSEQETVRTGLKIAETKAKAERNDSKG